MLPKKNIIGFTFSVSTEVYFLVPVPFQHTFFFLFENYPSTYNLGVFLMSKFWKSHSLPVEYILLLIDQLKS